MIEQIRLLKKEHEEIINLVLKINGHLVEEEIDFGLVALELKDLVNFWDSHEIREEEIFASLKEKGISFPNEMMFIEQHRELRGHWTVLNKAIDSQEEEKLRVALDTDGEMLITKLRNHIRAEDDYFNTLIIEELASLAIS